MHTQEAKLWGEREHLIFFGNFDVSNVFPPCSQQKNTMFPSNLWCTSQLINTNYKLVVGTHNRWPNPTTTTKEEEEELRNRVLCECGWFQKNANCQFK